MKSTTALERPAEEQPEKGPEEGPSRFEVLKQLEKIATSEHFRNSKRYPALLRFIVEHALSGRADVLKERVLGTEVFGRPSDYDTNADPVVRVAAGEIRKRLAQYYRMPGHEHELTIDIPLGSYVPHFLPAFPPPAAPPSRENGTRTHGAEAQGNGSEAAALSQEVPVLAAEILPATTPTPILAPSHVRAGRRWLFWGMAGFVAAILFLAGLFLGRTWRDRAPARAGGIAALWNPVLSSDNPALIVVGVHSLDWSGKDLSPSTEASAPPPRRPESMLSSEIYSDMLPVSDVVAYTQLTNLLARQGAPFRTQSAAQTTFGQLQRGPVVLLGGLNNVWTLRLTTGLRYRFANPTMTINSIVDSAHPGTKWSFDNSQSAISNSRDYALVASYFDPQIAQPVIIAAGIGKDGTAAATEFLTTNGYLKRWLAQSGPSKGKNNIELVLSTQIVEGEQGPPQVIAGYRW